MPIDTDLASFWELNEDGSSTRNDSKNGNHLTPQFTGMPGDPGLVGNGMFVSNGTDGGFCQDTSPSNINGGDIPFTVVAWIKRMGSISVNEGVFGKASSGVGRDFFLIAVASTGRLRWHVRNAADTGDANVNHDINFPTDGSWHMLTCDHNPTTDLVSLQYDLDTPLTAALSGGTRNISTTLMMGGDGNHSFVQGWGRSNASGGMIDQVGFWNRILTSAERNWLYNSGAGRSYAEIVAGMPATATIHPATMLPAMRRKFEPAGY